MSKLSRTLALLFAVLLAACGGDAGDGGGTEAGKPVTGGTAIFDVLGQFQGFNPVTVTHSTSIEAGRYMLFTPLFRYDEDLQPQPYLAERWELTDTSVTFHLRPDVRWHDGPPVTAEDVKFTFDLAKNPETASLLGSAYLSQIESATVVDPRTIRFAFSAPHAQALDGFWWEPLPKHLLEGVPPAELAQAEFNRNPVGSGPFRFVRWDQGEQLVLEANPDFPAELGGRPRLDRVVFKVLAEPTAMVTELLNGSADVIGYTLLPDQAQQVQQAPGATLKHFPAREFWYVAWNNTREPFSDPRIRRAMAMAMNRPELIEGLLHGFGTPAHGMIPPWSPLYTPAEPLPYDPAQAKRLLAEAGWTDSDGDGIVDKDGRPLRFTLLTNTENRLRQDIATVLQQQLRQVGVATDVRTMEFQSMLQQFKARDYDAVISAWILDTFKVDPVPLFACAEARKANTANRTGYCNPRADRLIEQGLRASDAGQAKQTWAEFSQILQQDQPMTFLFWLEDLGGVGPRIQGVEMDVRSKLVSVHDWWIPEDRRR